ncbi:MAG: ROK family protein [Stappiaceae bacterium]
MSDYTRESGTMTYGGIDLGGTKIDAALFDNRFTRLTSRRIATPRDSYAGLLNAIVAQVEWIRETANGPIPVGLGCPGFAEPSTGLARTSNLPANGRPLKNDLAGLVDDLVFGQDMQCFALSEATGGAGSAYTGVFGLIIGTGFGGAYCHDGQIISGGNGMPCEVGHIPLSAHVCNRHDLPLRPCGCGLIGCLETYASGPGMSALAEHFTGKPTPPPIIAKRAAAGEDMFEHIMQVWSEIVAEALHVVQLTLDPDCLVIGGGVSHISGLPTRLADAFERSKLPGCRSPEIKLAKFGDSSGTRGAAMIIQREN